MQLQTILYIKIAELANSMSNANNRNRIVPTPLNAEITKFDQQIRKSENAGRV